MISRVDLFYKYPHLFEWTGIAGFECRDGWLDLIDELSAKIVAIMPDAQASQVKEKYGELRMYMMSGSNEVEDIIDWYTKKSLRTCEVCGNYGELYDNGWMKVRCVECKLKED
jgi:hypothetical protein